jgi:hypothetical protein
LERQNVGCGRCRITTAKRLLQSSPANTEYLPASLGCAQGLTCVSRTRRPDLLLSPKTISQDELQSKLRSAASIAAETGTFLDYVGQNRPTNQYAKGHVEYLSCELAHTAKELSEALPPAGAEAEFTQGLEKVDALAAALRQLRSHVKPDELALEEDQIAAIRKQLQQAISSL